MVQVADFLELVQLAYEPVKQNLVSEAEYQERTARWRLKQADKAEEGYNGSG